MEPANATPSEVQESPEMLVSKYEESFHAWHSKLLLLSSAVRDDVADTTHKQKKVAENSYIETACMHVLRQKLLHNIVAGRNIANLLENPPDPRSSSALMCSIYNRLKERLHVSAQHSHELGCLEKELQEVHLNFYRTQTECLKTKAKFQTQLNSHAVEKTKLESKEVQETILKAQMSLSRKLLRTNFTRTLSVILISHSHVNLQKNRELAQILFDYAMPLTLRDIHKAIMEKETRSTRQVSGSRK